MKSLLAIFLIFGFLSVAVFGFLAVGHEGQGHVNCLAALSNGFTCVENSPIALANFHLSALKNFSTAIFENISAIVFALVLLLVLAGVAVFRDAKISFASRTAFYFENIIFSGANRIIHWLSLHENSPALAFGA